MDDKFLETSDELQSTLIECECGNKEFEAHYRKEMTNQWVVEPDALHVVFKCTKCDRTLHLMQKIK